MYCEQESYLPVFDRPISVVMSVEISNGLWLEITVGDKITRASNKINFLCKDLK